ncbi:hypothetical protein KAW38_03395 [Candidatus Micrarchaeota archaeon]|nr:hypothetical protein [Candidatus Micrarchaeota archaeon]
MRFWILFLLLFSFSFAQEFQSTIPPHMQYIETPNLPLTDWLATFEYSPCEGCPDPLSDIPFMMPVSNISAEKDIYKIEVILAQEKSGVRRPVEEATIFAVVIDRDAKKRHRCKMHTNEDGKAVFDFSDLDYCIEDGCTFKFIFCCTNVSVDCMIEACLQQPMATLDSIPACKNYVDAGWPEIALVEGVEPALFPTTVNFPYEKVAQLPKSDIEMAFCLPILLLFGLLAGGMFMLGRNPFAGFDFRGPKFSMGSRRAIRGRGMSFSAVNIASAAMKAGLAKATGAAAVDAEKTLGEAVKAAKGKGGGSGKDAKAAAMAGKEAGMTGGMPAKAVGDAILTGKIFTGQGFVNLVKSITGIGAIMEAKGIIKGARAKGTDTDAYRSSSSIIGNIAQSSNIGGLVFLGKQMGLFRGTQKKESLKEVYARNAMYARQEVEEEKNEKGEVVKAIITNTITGNTVEFDMSSSADSRAYDGYKATRLNAATSLYEHSAAIVKGSGVSAISELSGVTASVVTRDVVNKKGEVIKDKKGNPMQETVVQVFNPGTGEMKEIGKVEMKNIGYGEKGGAKNFVSDFNSVKGMTSGMDDNIIKGFVGAGEAERKPYATDYGVFGVGKTENVEKALVDSGLKGVSYTETLGKDFSAKPAEIKKFVSSPTVSLKKQTAYTDYSLMMAKQNFAEGKTKAGEKWFHTAITSAPSIALNEKVSAPQIEQTKFNNYAAASILLSSKFSDVANHSDIKTYKTEAGRISKNLGAVAVIEAVKRYEEIPVGAKSANVVALKALVESPRLTESVSAARAKEYMDDSFKFASKNEKRFSDYKQYNRAYMQASCFETKEGVIDYNPLKTELTLQETKAGLRKEYGEFKKFETARDKARDNAAGDVIKARGDLYALKERENSLNKELKEKINTDRKRAIGVEMDSIKTLREQTNLKLEDAGNRQKTLSKVTKEGFELYTDVKPFIDGTDSKAMGKALETIEEKKNKKENALTTDFQKFISRGPGERAKERKKTSIVKSRSLPRTPLKKWASRKKKPKA